MSKPEEFEMGRQERIWGEGLRSRPGEDCASAEDLIAFVEGRLEPAARMTVIQHIGHCTACRETVFLLRATERAVQPRVRGWQRFGPGIGLACGMAALAGALVLAANLWSPGKPSVVKPSDVAMHNPNKLNRELDPGSNTGQSPNTSTQANVQGDDDHPTKEGGASTALSTNNSLNTKLQPSGQNSHPVSSKPSGVQTKKPGGTTPPVGRTSPPPTSPIRSGPPDSGTRVAMGNPPVSSPRALKFLVGERHIYSLGDSVDSHQAERQKIEQDYADEVAACQAEYQKALDAGGQSDGESENLKNALDDLAAKRDNELSQLYENADAQLDTYPMLKVDGDGPYQVVEMKPHLKDEVVVYDTFVVHPPWPGYVVVDQPYGWAYGVEYNPYRFRNSYLSWHSHYVSLGRPAFVGFYGHSGPVRIDGLTRSSRGGFVMRNSTSGASRTTTPSRYGSPRTTSRYGGNGTSPRLGTSSTTSTGSKYGRYGGGLNRYVPGSTGPTRTSTGTYGAPKRYSGSSGYSRPSGESTAPKSTSRYGGGASSSRPTGSSNYGAGRSRSGTSGDFRSSAGSRSSGSFSAGGRGTSSPRSSNIPTGRSSGTKRGG